MARQLIYGVHPVTQALLSGRAHTLILPEGGSRSGIMPPAADFPCVYWPKQRFNQQFPQAVHQFCAAECAPLTFHKPEELASTRLEQGGLAGKLPLYLALTGVTDPHNFGACVRCAVAFSCQGLLFAAANSAELNAACAKAAAGMLEWLPLYRTSNLVRALGLLQKQGFWVVAGTGAASATLKNVDCQRPLILLLGSEDRGVGKLLLQHSDYTCRIPLNPRTESLNVSTACAVLLHHIQLLRGAG